jgi:hypothetical protein
MGCTGDADEADERLFCWSGTSLISGSMATAEQAAKASVKKS